MIGSSLRPAVTGDFASCRRLYLEEIAWIIDTLKLDMAKRRENFSVQLRLSEVRIITVAAQFVFRPFHRSRPRNELKTI
jgi:hypothetical protein